ncbi:MAG: glycosyltransferase family 39 protein [Allosphingosinicella sp.]|uniref:glycosyltransferase family 39 protein n=1 Tax=Allosphingosinicella sp. TaxID=2823234 RepID=UPI00394A55F8
MSDRAEPAVAPPPPARSGLSFIPNIGVLPAMIGLAVVSQILFMFQLQHPTQLFFDETHYVPAARDLIQGIEYRNVEHPLFAKTLIGISMLIFGDNPFGWRFFSTLMGTATIVAVFLIAQTIFRDVRISVAAAVLTLLNQLVYIQARIAMLDVYMGAFLLFALYFLLDSYQRGDAKRVKWGLILSGAMFGLAVGSKWAALPYFLGAAIAFYVIRDRQAKKAGVPDDQFLHTKDLPSWRGVSTMDGLFYFGGTFLAVYFLTFLPALFVETNRLGLLQIIPHQFEIYRQQTQPLSPHNYMSSWTQWPLIGRPIWYLYERVDGVLRGVLLVGNPAVMWGGLVAMLLVLRRGWRSKDMRLLLLAGLFAFSYGVYAVIPRNVSFYYYYYVPAIFLSIALAVAFDRMCRGGRAQLVPPAFFAATITLFIYFYPIISASPLQQDQDFLKWTWFDSWR